MNKNFPARRFVLLLLVLFVGCGKKNGELPVRDPAKETEAEARRTALVESSRPADAERIAAIRSRLPAPPAKDETKWPLAVGFRDATGWAQKFLLSPDATRVVAYVYDDAKKSIVYRVIDLATGKEVCRINAGAGALAQWIHSPDGTRLAAAMGNSIRIWDTTSGQRLHEFPFDKMVWSIAYTPDGAAIFASIAGRLILIDAESGQPKRTFAEEAVHASSPAVSRSGALVAAAAGTALDRVILWEVATGRTIREWNFKSGNGLIFSPDNWSLLVRGVDRLVVQDITAPAEQELSAECRAFPAISPDGKLVAYMSTTDLVVRDLATGSERRKKIKTVGSMVGFFPGGSYLATTDNGTLYIWDVQMLKE